MQITCSKCSKVYTVTSINIPGNVTATRCKACGNSIQLRPEAKNPAPLQKSPSPQTETSDFLKITCQYCSKKLKIKTRAIPEGATRIRCKSCGHKIALTPNASQASPMSKPSQTQNTVKRALNITCLYCGKKYNIKADKIPPGITSTKCKACGRPMSLKAAQPNPLEPKTAGGTPAIQMPPPKVSAPSPDTADAAIIADVGKPLSPLWKNRRMLAAAAGIILVLVTGYFGSSYWFKAGNSHMEKGKTISEKKAAVQKEKSIARTRAADQPFLATRLNVPLLLAAVDQNMPEDQKDLSYKMTTSIIKSFGLKTVELFLFPDAEHTALPVIFASSEEDNHFESMLKTQANFVQVLEPLSDGSYRFKKEAIPADKHNSVPIDLYRVQFVEDVAIMAPENLTRFLQEGPASLIKTRVAQMIASTAQPGDLATLSVRIPEDFNTDWQKKIQNNPAVQQNPQANMMIAMGGGVLAQLAEPLKDVDSLAISFRLDDANKRMLSYAQQFRDSIDGSLIYGQLQAGNPNDLDLDGMVLKLVELFNDPRFNHKVGYEQNRLTLALTWEQPHDEAIIAALTEATIGQLFTQGMALTPTEGPIAAQYVDTPRILPNVNVSSLKKTLPASIEENLFPGNYWAQGEEPHMTLDFDTLTIPNASLAQLKYEVVEVLSNDGASILRKEENTFQHIINPGSVSPGFIEINVKKDTPAESLKVARIQFDISLPARLKIFEFISDQDAIGTVRESGGITAKLHRLEKDVAKVNYRGGVSAQLYAFDRTGQALASRESMSSASSAVTRFQGEIYRLQVVVVEEHFEHPFEVVVDLNRGKELALSHKPEDPRRRRYDHRPMQTFASYSEKELAGLDVEWSEAGGMMWTDSLRVHLPRGPFSGDIRWEVHFFGEHEPIYLQGNAFQGPTGFSYGLSNGDLQKAHAAFGKVQMDLPSVIHRVTFDKQADGKSILKSLPSGMPIKVTFKQNEIALDAGRSDVIQLMAFDAKGLKLKKDGYTGIKGNSKKMYFWGLPSQFVIDVSTESINKTIDFDVRKRTVDEGRYKKFKQDIANHRVIVKTLRQIANARRKDRTKYGDDLAGLFYLYDHKKKKPMGLLEQKVAHSDPAGQERFGYTLKPYKGYYFSVLSGIKSGGTKTDYMRMPKQRSYRWKKGSIKTAPFLQKPDLVAIPADKSQPTFFMQFDQVFMKKLNGDKLTYLPEDYYSNGWVETKFVEG